MSHPLLQGIWLIPCYALIGAILSALWFPGITRRTGPRPSGYLNALMSLFSFLHAAFALPVIWNQPAQRFSVHWLDVAGLHLDIPIEVSALSVGAIVLITGLNLLAQTFAIGYLEMDWGWARFFSLLAFFEAGMTALVLCNSLFFAYFILELLTLATYLLIGIWFNQSLVVTGARDAFLTKRIGDLILLMGVVALLPLAGTWNFTELAAWAETATVDPKVITLVTLALIAGPMGKCAQFPLHLWLDEAMEGPVPASILRNGVVVATGAWLLVKLEPVLALSPFTLNALIAIGAVSAIGGTLIAIAQIDIKRTQSYLVTAYMGVVFIAVGVQQPQAALMIVLAHAVASGVMMMSCGAVVWNSITQDVTMLGGLWSRRPISGMGLLAGMIGLVAVPPFGGFWSMLDLANGVWNDRPWIVGILLLVNALAGFGIIRVFCLLFLGESKEMAQRSPEVHYWMILPMVVLGSFVLHLPLVMQALHLLPSWAEVNLSLALLLTWSSIAGISFGAIVYLNKSIPKPVRLPWKGLQDLLAYDFYTPNLYRSTIVFAVAVVSSITSWFDKYLVDGFINLFGSLTIFSGNNLRYSTSGQSQFYMLTILLGVVVIGALLSLPFFSHVSISLLQQNASDLAMNVQR